MTEGTRSSSGMLAEAPQRCEKGVRGDAIEGAAGGGVHPGTAWGLKPDSGTPAPLGFGFFPKASPAVTKE